LPSGDYRAHHGVVPLASVVEKLAWGVVNLFRHMGAWRWRAARVPQDGPVSLPNASLCDILPGGVCLGTDLSVDASGEEVSTRTEVVADGAEWTQEALGVLDRFELLQDPLALACRQ
jgi:hypothetical protein